MAEVATLRANPFYALSLDRSVGEVITYPPNSLDWAMVVKGVKRISLVGFSLP